MKTVAKILELAAPLTAGFHIRIENEPWMTLVIEDTQERGPNGLPAISVAHYGEQNGDAMRDPAICAEVVLENGAAKLWPYYFRNDYAGVERWNRLRDLESFMEMWDGNIQDQGFLEAFRRTAGQRC